MKALATSRPLLRILLKAMYAHIDVLLYIKVTIGELYWLLHVALQHPPHPLQQVVTPGYYGSCRSLPCCRQSVWCRRAAVLQSLHSTHGSIGGGEDVAPTISGPVSGYNTGRDNRGEADLQSLYFMHLKGQIVSESIY